MTLHAAVLLENQDNRRWAAKKCKQLYMGKYAWSPEWRSYQLPIRLWKMVVKRFQGKEKGRVQPRYLQRLMNQCDQPDAKKLTLEEAQTKLEMAEQTFKEACTRAADMRQEHIKNLSKALAEKNNTSEEAEMKKLTHIANQRKRARRIRRATKKPSKGLATKLLERNPDGDTTVDTQEDLIRVSACANCTRFTRCIKCSFLHGQFLTDIGLLAEGPGVGHIMDGTYNPPPGTDQYEALLLQELQMPEVVKNNPMPTPHITMEDHKKGWQKQKEHTAGEPTSLDFSLHIAASYDDLLADIDSTLRTIPLEEGFSPPEWERMTDCSIPKKANVLYVDKMRTICLMDPAYNMNNKAYGRSVMSHNEKLGTLAEEQAGSRKRRRASEVALQKVLTMDILRQQRKSGFLCSNDALQCYDRIVHNVAIMCMRSRGAHPKALQSLFQTLQNVEHSVMTGYGTSDPMYGGPERKAQGQHPIQGVMQGNGMGPFIWAFISTVLIGCMHRMGFTCHLAGCMTGLLIRLMGYCFVDDSDLVFSAEDNTTPAARLLNRFQAAVDCWEGVLRATGGGLEHTKTFWYLIDHKFVDGKWHYHSVADTPGDISIRRADSEDRVLLERKEPSEASKTLGIYMAMDGSQEAEEEFLREKGIEWADSYRTSGGLEKNDAWMGILTTILKTFNYPAQATQLTRDQWDNVVAPVFQVGLPKSGISRMFPRKVLFGPTLNQGLGVLHPFHFQELEHLETILRCGNETTTTGALIQLSMESLRLELGLPGQVTDWNFSKLHKCATDSWLKTVWKYCHDHGMEVEDSLPQLHLAREHDKFLMEVFLKQNYSPEQLRILNQCRMFLKAVTLADISSADGNSITPEAREGFTSPHRANSWTWPRQPNRLPVTHWDLWKKALDKCFLRPYSEGKLWLPLGRWTLDPSETWGWMHQPDSNLLYQHSPQGWMEYAQRTNIPRKGGLCKKTGQILPFLPPDSNPASIRECRRSTNCVILTGFPPFKKAVQEQAPDPIPTNLAEQVETIDDASLWAVEKLHLGPSEGNQQGGNVAAAVLRGKARAVSDGSYKHGHGTSSFSIHGDDSNKAIRGANTIPGSKAEHCAYRSELGGVTGIVTMAEAICKQFQLDSGKIEIGLDGESVITKLQSPYPPSPTDSHYDMLLDCKERIKKLPIKVEFRWIEGHQDDPKKKGRRGKLDWWARQNIRMDHKAKKHWRLTHKSTPPNAKFSNEPWSVKVHGKKLSSFKKEAIHELIATPPIKDYWQQKHSISESTWEDINWEASKQAIKSSPLGKKRWAAKFATSHCATGRMMLRRKEWAHSKCPRCGQEDECPMHVCRCKDPEARKQWNSSVKELEKWMDAQDTDPLITKHVLAMLKSWVQEHDAPVQPSAIARCNRSLHKALLAQSTIGAWNTLLGRISKQLTQQQQKRYEKEGSLKTGLRWTSSLILKLQNVAWDMWEHRNGILHNYPDRHHRKQALEEANALIDKEWVRSNQGLLRQDKFLFRDKKEVCNRPLERKWQWLSAVTAARSAAQADAANTTAYDGERRRLQEFLAGSNKRAGARQKNNKRPKKKQNRNNDSGPQA